MAAQLASTVYVQDPDTHQTIRLEPGTSPEPRLAALVTNPAAWVDGKLPRLPKDRRGDGPDDAAGDAPASTDADPATKPAARKSAAAKPARGRSAADQGTSGA